MKNVILGLTLLSSVAMSSAFACSPEAQFIGTVKNATVDCQFEIEFSKYSSSVVCPLVLEEALTVYTDKTCSLKDGDQISGVLIKNDGVVEIE